MSAHKTQYEFQKYSNSHVKDSIEGKQRSGFRGFPSIQASIKGQTISKANYGVLNSPKKKEPDNFQ